MMYLCFAYLYSCICFISHFYSVTLLTIEGQMRSLSNLAPVCEGVCRLRSSARVYQLKSQALNPKLSTQRPIRQA